MGSVRLQVNSRLLGVKISECQKLHTHFFFNREGVSEPINPHSVEGLAAFDFLRCLEKSRDEATEGVGTNSPVSTMTKLSLGTKKTPKDRKQKNERDRTGLEESW